MQAFNINDFASSNPDCDKSKMMAHENLACRYGSMLRFKTCTTLPQYTGAHGSSGSLLKAVLRCRLRAGEWSLATDQCMDYLQGSTESANQFMDVGQCNNIGLRETSEKIWWDNHTSSFAMRQIAMFEQELGWAFWTYKLGSREDDLLHKYWCFRCAVKEGWIDTNYPTNRCEKQLGEEPGC